MTLFTFIFVSSTRSTKHDTSKGLPLTKLPVFRIKLLLAAWDVLILAFYIPWTITSLLLLIATFGYETDNVARCQFTDGSWFLTQVSVTGCYLKIAADLFGFDIEFLDALEHSHSEKIFIFAAV